MEVRRAEEEDDEEKEEEKVGEVCEDEGVEAGRGLREGCRGTGRGRTEKSSAERSPNLFAALLALMIPISPPGRSMTALVSPKLSNTFSSSSKLTLGPHEKTGRGGDERGLLGLR
jgi:hypothetical protein